MQMKTNRSEDCVSGEHT